MIPCLLSTVNMTTLGSPLLLLKYVVTEVQDAIMIFKCLSLPCGTNLPILLSPAESRGFGSGNVNALIEYLWRAKQHLPTKLTLVVSPLLTLALTPACATCASGTRTRLETAMR